MQPLTDLIHTLIRLRESGQAQITLLAVCPNSAAVLEAAVKAAARQHAPMLLAATLNQVDRDGGYTGWTQAQFVAQLHAFARRYAWQGPLYPCLDHGGPWLKDRHTLDGLSYLATMAEVKRSLSACLEAGYQLLHIDPTVDRRLPPGEPPLIADVVARTLELIAHSEAERQRLGVSVAYEVGTEEVHGGLVDLDNFTAFLSGLRAGLQELHLEHAWPAFIVGKVGTDLHTADFSPEAARELYDLVAPLGSLIKGHYTDWVANPQDYPLSGMGGANVGPEFTAVEVLALRDLCNQEADLNGSPSGFMQALEAAVVRSGRWQKWLQPAEQGLEFAALSPERREWLLQTGARYIWTDPQVVAARARLYQRLSPHSASQRAARSVADARVLPDPHAFVVERITQAIEKYMRAFNLVNSLEILDTG